MKALRFSLLLLLAAVISAPAFAGEPEGEAKRSLDKSATNDQWDFISVNNILMWLSNNGRTAHNPLSDQSGMEWPKNSAKYVVFTDGILWGGRVEGQIRVGGATYNAGLQAGHIKSDGTASDPSDPRARIYKILKVDRIGFEGLDHTLQTRLQKDFTEWPAEFGAPFVDKNGNGVYDPNFEDWLENGDNSSFDIPFLPGDETIWFVSNDLDNRRTSNLYGTAPIGIELHTLTWAYNQQGPLANMIFSKYTVINKGVNDITDAYFSKWSDPDLGDAFDDFVGIDTTLSLGYCYNGLAKDEVYGIPPAMGYDFFQGPIVPDAATTAHYNFGLRQGFRNLPVSTFAFYINGNSTYRDPALKDPGGSIEMYNYMQGFLWNRRPYRDPTSNQDVKVCLAGDPITRDGWIDGIISTPGDRRFLMTAGPFTLAKGDTQEVVVSAIVARGSDRLSSLKVLKYYDKFAQLAFDNNFDLPKAPPAPVVKASLLDRKLILHWGDPESVNKVEKHIDRGFKFQGYNIYQFPTRSSTLADGIRLATYDVEDGIAIIFDEFIDEKTGVILDLPAQFGTDGGIIRTIDITRDALIDRPLVNNQPYYFAVTAYAYNDDPTATPRQLESTPVILELRPQIPNPGVRFPEEAGDKIPINHTAGTSSGRVEVEVIDPTLLTGDTYEVSFASIGDTTVEYDHNLDNRADTSFTVPNFGAWTLTNVTKQRKVIDGARNFQALEKEYFVVDGFKIGISGQGVYGQFTEDKDPGNLRLNHDEILAREWSGGPEVFTPYESDRERGGYWWEMGYGNEYGSTIKGFTIDRVVEIRFDTTKPSKGYMYLRGVSPNYSYQGYYDSPVSFWDVTNPTQPRQLSYAWVEQKNSVANDNRWMPTTSPNDRENIYILDENYSDTPNPKWTKQDPSNPNSRVFSLQTDGKNMPILYYAWYLLKPDYANRRIPWQNGSKWLITPKVPFSAADKYTFTTLKQTFSTDIAKKDVSKINVFPNPYFGANAREQNKYQRFVTINHLPNKANFRIYTLSGTLVRSFSKKEDGTQYASWDLNNDNGLPVGSGLYYIHIEMPEIQAEKVLRVAIVAETQFLDRI